MKKFLSIILVLMAFCFGLAVSVYAEAVNPFPPQKREVGVMDFDSYLLGTSAAIRTNSTVNVLSGSFTDYLRSRFSNITDAVDVACIENGVIVL